MIKVCGDNYSNQLIRESNNKASNRGPIISPPLKIIHSYLSHFISAHTAIITQEGELHVIGYNENFRISASLPEETLKQLTRLQLKDNDGNQHFPISVVCGFNYTLFLVSTTSSGSVSNRRLAFFSIDTKTQNPILNFDRQPQTQFHSSAASSSSLNQQ